MKRIITALITLFITITASAQSREYITNHSAWFMGVGVGSSMPTNYHISTDFYFGKWFTPTVGFKLGMENMMLLGKKQTVTDIVYSDGNYNVLLLKDKRGVTWHGNTYGSLLFDITSAAGGYNERRIWNLIMYPTFSTYFSNNSWGFGCGAGITNQFRLAEGLRLNIDAKANAVTNKVFADKDINVVPSISIGLSYNFGKKGKKGFKEASAYVNDCRPIIRDTVFIQKRDTVYVEKIIRDTNRYVVTFDINSYVIKHLEGIKIKDFLSGVDKNREIVIIGSADSNTGNVQRNKYLAEERAYAIKSELIKLGFYKISVLTAIDYFDNREMTRAAIIEIK